MFGLSIRGKIPEAEKANLTKTFDLSLLAYMEYDDNKAIFGQLKTIMFVYGQKKMYSMGLG